MDEFNTNNTNSRGLVKCTPKNPNSGLNTAEGFMSACEAGTIQVTMGMFFDGTGNNRENVANGKSGSEDSFINSKFYGSYFNGLSNVARAWKYYSGSLNGKEIKEKGEEDVNNGGRFNIYIEGIGTNNGKRDDLIFGSALGIDSVSGIKQRVILGSKKAAEAILAHENIKNVINTINKIEVTFDVFGFSRGAAAVRHFISKNTEIDSSRFSPDKPFNSELEYQINNLHQEEMRIEVIINWRFAGLYETVSSHGADFEDDVGELGLDAISKAETIVHLVAEDEYRENFSLTTVSGNSRVIKLPGVHSDIGGGYSNIYKNGTEENENVIYKISYKVRPISNLPPRNIAQRDISSVRDWFINNGWYKDDFRLKINDNRGGQSGSSFSLEATRKGIKNTYSHIPLHIMTKQAIANGVNFDNALFSSYPIESGLLSKIYSSGSAGVNLNALTSDELLTFRYKYLHWSSRLNATGHSPRIKDELSTHPKFKRNIISG